ncbi:MAG: hypothetical protein WBK55_01460 [Alphaproteobacteria bacterium]
MSVSVLEEPKTRDQLVVEAFLQRSKDLVAKGQPKPPAGSVEETSPYFGKFTDVEHAVLQARYGAPGNDSGPA